MQIVICMIVILIALIPLSYWFGGFKKENQTLAFLSSSKFRNTDYREWKEYCEDNKI